MRPAAARLRPARELTAELVELLRGAPELVVYGREADTLARVAGGGATSSRGSAGATRSRPGVADGLVVLVAGLTVAGVLAVAAHDAVDSTGCSWRRSRCSRWRRSRRVAPLRGRRARALGDDRGGPARARARRPRAGRPRSRRAPAGAARAATVALEGVTARYAPDEPGRAQRLRPPARARPPGRARRPERRRQDDGREPAAPLPRSRGGPRDDRRARRARATARTTCGARSRSPGRTRTSSTRRSAPTSASRARTRPTTELEDALDRARIGDWVASLPDGLDTLVGEEGATLSGGQRQRLDGRARAARPTRRSSSSTSRRRTSTRRPPRRSCATSSKPPATARCC